MAKPAHRPIEPSLENALVTFWFAQIRPTLPKLLFNLKKKKSITKKKMKIFVVVLSQRRARSSVKLTRRGKLCWVDDERGATRFP